MAEIVQAYTDFGYKWGGGAFGTPGGNVSWSIATNNFASRWTFENFMGELNMDATGLVAAAFRAWSGVANITFGQVGDGEGVGIRLGMFFIDGHYGTTGLTATRYSSAGIFEADVALDSADQWDAAGNAYRFYGTVLHEIGHALGLEHEDAVPALMNTVDSQFGYSIQNLYPDDVAGIQNMYGKPAQVTYWGSPFADTLHGGSDNDLFYGLTSGDWMAGKNGSDTLYGNAGPDIVYGNKGTDYLHGQLGNDTLYGGQQPDEVYGQDGLDLIYGNLGNDLLMGMTGNDLLYGGQGDDVIAGGPGADVIYGNRGNDVMSGGTNADQWFFAHNSGMDRINDFNPGVDKLLVKVNVNGSGLLTVNDLLSALANTVDGVQLNLGGGHAVELIGLTAADLSAADFQMF